MKNQIEDIIVIIWMRYRFCGIGVIRCIDFVPKQLAIGI